MGTAQIAEEGQEQLYYDYLYHACVYAYACVAATVVVRQSTGNVLRVFSVWKEGDVSTG